MDVALDLVARSMRPEEIGVLAISKQMARRISKIKSDKYYLTRSCDFPAGCETFTKGISQRNLREVYSCLIGKEVVPANLSDRALLLLFKHPKMNKSDIFYKCAKDKRENLVSMMFNDIMQFDRAVAVLGMGFFEDIFSEMPIPSCDLAQAVYKGIERGLEIGEPIYNHKNFDHAFNSNWLLCTAIRFDNRPVFDRLMKFDYIDDGYPQFAAIFTRNVYATHKLLDDTRVNNSHDNNLMIITAAQKWQEMFETIFNHPLTIISADHQILEVVAVHGTVEMLRLVLEDGRAVSLDALRSALNLSIREEISAELRAAIQKTMDDVAETVF